MSFKWGVGGGFEFGRPPPVGAGGGGGDSAEARD